MGRQVKVVSENHKRFLFFDVRDQTCKKPNRKTLSQFESRAFKVPCCNHASWNYFFVTPNQELYCISTNCVVNLFYTGFLQFTTVSVDQQISTGGAVNFSNADMKLSIPIDLSQTNGKIFRLEISASNILFHSKFRQMFTVAEPVTSLNADIIRQYVYFLFFAR